MHENMLPAVACFKNVRVTVGGGAVVLSGARVQWNQAV